MSRHIIYGKRAIKDTGKYCDRRRHDRETVNNRMVSPEERPNGRIALHDMHTQESPIRAVQVKSLSVYLSSYLPKASFSLSLRFVNLVD